MRSMGDLHRWCIGISIYCDNFNTKALEFDHNLFAKLARSEHEDFNGTWCKRCSDLHSRADMKIESRICNRTDNMKKIL